MQHRYTEELEKKQFTQEEHAIMMNYFENANLYNLHEMQHAGFAPIHMMANASKHFYSNPLSPIAYTDYGRHLAAASELLERITKRYPKPDFRIKHTEVEGKKVKIDVETALQKSFCNLLHFKKSGGPKKESRLLIIAPMSGHHATLLRGTVEGLLPYHDVYITDWLDASGVATSAGRFDLHSYIDYLIEFLEFLGPKTHTLAVCQPSVPMYAAAATMNETKNPCAPATMTLIGGPIDTRKAPTKVNLFAKEHPISWFERNVITRVPFNYPGFMRRVYPGFLQLTGFMSMNIERHVGEHLKLFQHLVEGDGESAEFHRKFYNEYLAVADLPAEFYLQTIQEVFQKHSLPEGKLMHHSRPVRPEAITKTALLCIEGELDDISGVGQTKAAIDISSGLPKEMRQYYLQEGVGHYGIFNGRRFRDHVRPVISAWIEKFN